MTETVEIYTHTIATLLHAYWQRGLLVGGPTDEWKIDLVELHEEARKVAESVEQSAIEEWRASKAMPGYFAEIDAKELDDARNDPAVRKMADAGDRHLETLRQSGRMSLS
jgi:hypothetical protein